MSKARTANATRKITHVARTLMTCSRIPPGCEKVLLNRVYCAGDQLSHNVPLRSMTCVTNCTTRQTA